MRVNELTIKGDSLVGTPVTISDQLFVTGDKESFVAADDDSFDRHERILICDGALIADHLLDSLPVYAGGSCIYYEQCTISGVLQKLGTGYRLAAIRSCTVTRDDVVIEIPFPGADA